MKDEGRRMKILVSDDVSDSGLQPLRAAAFDVVKKTGLSKPDLIEALSDCEGLIVRSETKVTADDVQISAQARSERFSAGGNPESRQDGFWRAHRSLVSRHDAALPARDAAF